jgi:pimeloyl-ACP methyl ester carboxylesterase
MRITNRRTGLSRRTFMLAGAAGALVARWTLSRAHAQPAAGTLNFRVTGTQSPSLIFVHGFTCALEDWDAQAKALSPKFRCAALDLPGHGASAKPAHGSIASLAAAVNQVKEGVGRGGKILVGHSMGCRVIMEAYLQSRADVVGLVFVDGSMLGGDPEPGVKRAQETARAGIDALIERLFKDMFLEGSDPAVRERLVARAKKVDPLLREELFVDMVRWDLTKARDALKQIAVPVMVLQSTYFNNELKRVSLKPGMTTPWMDAIAASVPKSQAKVVPNAGHFCQIDAPRMVSEEIGKFAAAVGTPA